MGLLLIALGVLLIWCLVCFAVVLLAFAHSIQLTWQGESPNTIPAAVALVSVRGIGEALAVLLYAVIIADFLNAVPTWLRGGSSEGSLRSVLLLVVQAFLLSLVVHLSRLHTSPGDPAPGIQDCLPIVAVLVVVGVLLWARRLVRGPIAVNRLTAAPSQPQGDDPYERP